MSFLSRLVFVGFIALTGLITYNALYLQDDRSGASRMASRLPEVQRQELPVRKPAQPAADTTTTASTQPQVQEASTALVTAIERELSVRGYDTGNGDGVVTDALTNAILAYQRDSGLPETGTPTDGLLRNIVLGVSVADAGGSGTAGEASSSEAIVRAVQETLGDLGYAPGPIDGMMGENTRKAIIAFQKDRRIAQSGEITPALLEEIELVSGRQFAGGATYR
ncbi:peptidoglycan-binding domain-containing protein [Methyloligella sp. 2.7D]|uniref:peptidoglycan-binding domain-containing protein n=1 Tax=unclassified Methyloligella TaxID=2625955 RepID=UPI00157D64E5|nr:peptidoglycan-binding domain-containing protein [Methyloligella sp. GL2]QKP77096.1 peptidoglycan-binding protein [Methyloligella sp. GL2]